VLSVSVLPSGLYVPVQTSLPTNRAEASGGITIETVPEYAATGVDIILMGSLTHSAPQLDYSFRTGEG
jgi:nicotinate-nucleotide pyrophosphorylase